MELITLPFNLRMPLLYSEFEVLQLAIRTGVSPEFLHKHSCYELLYTLEGSVYVENNEINYELPPSHSCIIATDTSHRIICEPQACYFIMHFSQDTKRTIRKGNYDNGLFLRLSEASTSNKTIKIFKDQYSCHMFIDRIKTELSQKDWGYRTILGNLCSDLLLTLLRNIPHAHFEGEDFKIEQDEHSYAPLIVKYISDHFSESLSIEKVAEVFHLSSRHVNRLLIDYCDLNFVEVVNSYRLNKAKILLTTTNFSLERISEEIGFNTTKSLYNLFAKYESMTPSEYKKSKRSE